MQLPGKAAWVGRQVGAGDRPDSAFTLGLWLRSNRRRAHARDNLPEHRGRAEGTQLRVGHGVSAGDVFPVIVMRVWGQRLMVRDLGWLGHVLGDIHGAR